MTTTMEKIAANSGFGLDELLAKAEEVAATIAEGEGVLQALPTGSDMHLGLIEALEQARAAMKMAGNVLKVHEAEALGCGLEKAMDIVFEGDEAGKSAFVASLVAGDVLKQFALLN